MPQGLPWQEPDPEWGSAGRLHAFGIAYQSFNRAFKVKPPDNGRIIRNIIEGAQFVHSHILWFYHLNALDYVDVVSALSAKTSDPKLLAVQAKLKTFVESGQLGPFANAYWGHPAYKLPAEVNLLAVSHYLDALQMQAEASHASAIFGGRMPMTMTSPPGGVNCMVDLDLLAQFLYRLKKVKNFIETAYIPDVLAVAPFYLDWAGIGKGHGNYLAWGVFDDPASRDPYKSLLPRGAIYADKGLVPQQVGPEMVTEDTTHGWYKNGPALNPSQGVTDPDYTGYDTNAKYTWAKAPRLNGKPMEVGALSRMLVAYTSGQPQAKALIDATLAKLGVPGKPEVLLSVLGRIAARALESKIVADAMEGWAMQLASMLAPLPDVDEVLVRDELVAVALEDDAREGAAADDEDLLVVLLQLLDERQEVAVAADDDVRVDVRVRERHLERIEREIDVGAVLVATRRQAALDHADRVLREEPAVVAGTMPVAVRNLRDHLAALFDPFEHGGHVELLVQGRLHADLDVVEIDEHREFQTFLCHFHLKWLASL